MPETATPTRPKRRAKKDAADVNEEEAQQNNSDDDAISKGGLDLDVVEPNEIADNKPSDQKDEEDDPLEILAPQVEPRQWLIGKPPEKGGTEKTYSIYVQQPLSYISRMKFFALVSRTIAKALKQGGSLDFGSGAIIDPDEDISVKARMDRLRSADFADAGSFMTMAFQLMSFSDTFLLDCYVLWLDVPKEEVSWAKRVMSQHHTKFGLTDSDGLEMVEVFIDQNYEDIRDFFAEDVPKLWKRVQAREKDRQDHKSESDQSKQ